MPDARAPAAAAWPGHSSLGVRLPRGGHRAVQLPLVPSPLYHLALLIPQHFLNPLLPWVPFRKGGDLGHTVTLTWWHSTLLFSEIRQ